MRAKTLSDRVSEFFLFVTDSLHFLDRLLDICLGRKTAHETQLMLVFEHIDQDLDMYLRALPPAGLEVDEIKVYTQCAEATA